MVRLLAGFPEGEGLDRLSQIAKSHPDVTFCKEAIRALQHSNNPKAKDALFLRAAKAIG